MASQVLQALGQVPVQAMVNKVVMVVSKAETTTNSSRSSHMAQAATTKGVQEEEVVDTIKVEAVEDLTKVVAVGAAITKVVATAKQAVQEAVALVAEEEAHQVVAMAGVAEVVVVSVRMVEETVSMAVEGVAVVVLVVDVVAVVEALVGETILMTIEEVASVVVGVQEVIEEAVALAAVGVAADSTNLEIGVAVAAEMETMALAGTWKCNRTPSLFPTWEQTSQKIPLCNILVRLESSRLTRELMHLKYGSTKTRAQTCPKEKPLLHLMTLKLPKLLSTGSTTSPLITT